MSPDQAPAAAPNNASEPEVLQLVAPNGLVIVGTLERIVGRSNTLGFTRAADGSLEPEYTGYTEVFWNDQETAHTRTGEIIVLDSDGNEWPISACQVDEEDGDGET
jgi:hypothetical protein